MKTSPVVFLVIAAAIGGCAGQRTVPVPARETPKVESEVAKEVDSLDWFKEVKQVGDDRISLAIRPGEKYERLLSVNFEPWTDRAEAKVGDRINVGCPDLLGAGARWYDFLGMRNGRVQLRETYWFYDITPDEHRLFSVRPYADAR
jgi:hypothetical protein